MRTNFAANSEEEAPKSSVLRPKTRVGHWEVEGELGRGANGVVYAANDVRTGEKIAVKCLTHGTTESLRREFRVLAEVRHENIVRLGELGQADGVTYFTMERLMGRDILSHLRGLDASERPSAVQRCFGQLAGALCYLHRLGLVHRDIKAANVMADGTGKVSLLDFGLTRPAPTDPAAASSGLVSGTLVYLAPERFRGRAAQPSSDWFAFGVLLFEALVGELPFGPRSQDTVLAWYAGRPVPDVRARLGHEHAHLADLLVRLLDPDPTQRPTGAEIVASMGGRATPSSLQKPVGRERELAWLEARLLGGAPARIVVSGESGIGKTTLMRSLRQRALEQERLVLESRCHPREQLPFNALNEVVVTLLGEPLDSEGAAPHRELALLRELFADGDAPRREDVSVSTMTEALLAVLRHHARLRPVLVLVDDLQWIDHDSMPILEQLWRAPNVRMSWAATLRGDRSSLPANLAALVDDHLGLVRLDESTAARLVAHLRPDLAEGDAARLRAATFGHPLSIEQACSFGPDSGFGASTDTPEALLTARIASRSETQRELLELLAVHDGAASAELLYACQLSSVSDVYELVDADLVTFRRNGVDFSVGVRHALLGESLRSQLPSERIAALHGRIADACLAVAPEDTEAAFYHLKGAGRREAAVPFALASARAFKDRLAFQRAGERLSWLVDGEENAARKMEWESELADVFARAGAAGEAAEAYLRIARTDDMELRLRARRSAAEQLLRSGKIADGRALLNECAREVEFSLPEGTLRRIFGIAWRRVAIALQKPSLGEARTSPQQVRQRMDVAWSAGLGLNAVDILASGVAQAEYTRLALRYGSSEERVRAWAVEYSFTMNATAGATKRGAQILEFLDTELPRVTDPYTRGMAQLSWAAGDYFRGCPELALQRVEHAKAQFSTMLGSLSWELANCSLYEMWSLLEAGHLDELASRVPALLAAGNDRGDALYQRYWTGGHCAAAWLVLDRPEELRELLQSGSSTTKGSFEVVDVFLLIARVRLELYEGRGAEALALMLESWGRIRRAGMDRLEWFSFTFQLLRLQAACAAPTTATTLKSIDAWSRALSRSRHPAAAPWRRVFRAWLEAKRGAGDAPMQSEWSAAADALEGRGFALAARALRHQLAVASQSETPAWPASVADPNRWARAMALELPL